MSDYYKIVADEAELKWFFEHILEPPLNHETYMICLSARNKKLNLKERLKYQLGRGEMMRTELIRRKGDNWNFNIYKQGPYKYNCHKSAMLTKSGDSYPSKCLVCYAYVNPSDELDCVHYTFQFYNNIQHELIESYNKNSVNGISDHLKKLPKIFEHLRSCHATNISRRIWRDFDFDVEVPEKFKSEYNIDEAKSIVLPIIIDNANVFYGKGNYAIVDTSGGFHVLVKTSAMRCNPNDFISSVVNSVFRSKEGILSLIKDLCKEVKLTEAGSQFLPMPGTLQYGRLVTIINKEDFEL